MEPDPVFRGRVGKRVVVCYEYGRSVVVDDCSSIKLTQTEFQIMVQLLGADKVTDAHLRSMVFDEFISPAAMRKQFDRLDDKLNPVELYVHRLRAYGYALSDRPRK